MENVIVNIEDGQLLNPKVVRAFFDKFKEGRGLLTYRSLRKRSLNTNSYLHVVFTMLIEPLRDAGWENIRNMEDAKEFVKRLFLTEKITNEKTGEVIERVKNTSELTQEECNIFIADIQRWSAEYMGFEVPDPCKPIPMFSEPIIAERDNINNLTIVSRCQI